MSTSNFLEQLEPCSECGSSDLAWCGISVRPYCRECGHWGRVNYGSPEEAIKNWNASYERVVETQEKLEQHASLLNENQRLKDTIRTMMNLK